MNLAGYKAFLTLGYWFAMRPVPMPSNWILALLILFGIFLSSRFIFFFAGKRADVFLAKRLRAFGRLFWYAGLLGLFWLFFSYEEAIILGSRFWFPLLLMTVVVRAVFIIRDMVKNMPKERTALAEQERFQKYLPKKKK